MTPRILIVDDSATIRRALELILRPKGFELEFAATGSEAIERARSFGPTLVVLDYVLPDMRGPDVCTALESLPQTAATPIVLVSAKGASVREAYRDARNVVTYITKPFKPGLVVSVVENALSSRPAAQPRAPIASSSGPGTQATPLRAHREAVLDTLLRHVLEGLGAAETRSRDEMREGIAKLCRLLDAGRQGLAASRGRWVLDPRGALVSIDEILLDAHRQLCSLTRSLPSPAPRHNGGTAVLALASPHEPHADALAELARTIDEPRLFVAPDESAFEVLAHLLRPCAVVLTDLPPAQIAGVVARLATPEHGGPRQIRLVRALPSDAISPPDPSSAPKSVSADEGPALRDALPRTDDALPGSAAAFSPGEMRVGIAELAATLRELARGLANVPGGLAAGSAAEMLEVVVL